MVRTIALLTLSALVVVMCSLEFIGSLMRNYPSSMAATLVIFLLVPGTYLGWFFSPFRYRWHVMFLVALVTTSIPLFAILFGALRQHCEAFAVQFALLLFAPWLICVHLFAEKDDRSQSTATRWILRLSWFALWILAISPLSIKVGTPISTAWTLTSVVAIPISLSLYWAIRHGTWKAGLATYFVSVAAFYLFTAAILDVPELIGDQSMTSRLGADAWSASIQAHNQPVLRWAPQGLSTLLATFFVSTLAIRQDYFFNPFVLILGFIWFTGWSVYCAFFRQATERPVGNMERRGRKAILLLTLFSSCIIFIDMGRVLESLAHVRAQKEIDFRRVAAVPSDIEEWVPFENEESMAGTYFPAFERVSRQARYDRMGSFNIGNGSFRVAIWYHEPSDMVVAYRESTQRGSEVPFEPSVWIECFSMETELGSLRSIATLTSPYQPSQSPFRYEEPRAFMYYASTMVMQSTNGHKNATGVPATIDKIQARYREHWYQSVPKWIPMIQTTNTKYETGNSLFGSNESWKIRNRLGPLAAKIIRTELGKILPEFQGHQWVVSHGLSSAIFMPNLANDEEVANDSLESKLLGTVRVVRYSESSKLLAVVYVGETFPAVVVVYRESQFRE